MQTLEHTPAVTDAAEVLRGLLRGRYSCRAYRSERVPRETIQAILEMARLTASWANTQPWHVVITSGAATDRFRAALVQYAAAHPQSPDISFPRAYLAEYASRRSEAASQLYASVGAKNRQDVAHQAAENYRLFGAPHLALLTAPETLGVYGAIDCGLWIANFMLAAQSLGVACIAQAAIAGQSPFVHEYFGIGSDRLIVCGISFGYEATAHPANGFRTSRADLSATVEWRDD